MIFLYFGKNLDCIEPTAVKAKYKISLLCVGIE